MKPRRSRLLFVLLAFYLIALFCPLTARADNDDFNPNYDFSPDLVGYLGADMNLLLIVENTGTTDITWVGVGIDTQTPYTGRWNGSPPIHPGDTRRLSFNVPFSNRDVDNTRTMQVTMNNDGDAGSDGSKTFRFRITSTDNVFSVSQDISSDGRYHPGDTVTITMSYRNNITTHAATGVVTDAWLTKDGVRLTNLPEVSQGTIMPGASKTSTLTYTLRDTDVGQIAIHYDLRGKMMGRNYHIGGSTPFDVTEIPTIPGHTLDPGSSEPESPEVIFTASLSAEPTVIDAGDTVKFRVTVRNTGDDDIGGFEITDMGGATELNAEGMTAGADGSVIISKSISETCDMRFVVIGRTGDLSVSKETNSVHITVRETSPETVSPAPSPTASSTPMSTTLTPSPVPPSSSPLVAAAEARPSQELPTTVLLIVIAVLLLAITALLAVLLRKKKAKLQ